VEEEKIVDEEPMLSEMKDGVWEWANFLYQQAELLKLQESAVGFEAAHSQAKIH
jgi:hypothetical protein